MLLPRVRAKFSRDALVAGASVLYALAALALAHVQNIALLAVAMLATGVAWISILSALQVSAQMTLPAWVRARGLAAFVVVFMGGMALGSVLWGQVATHIGIPRALTIAAAGHGRRDRADVEIQARPARGRSTSRRRWTGRRRCSPRRPSPTAARCMVTIEYRVQPDKRAEFVTAMQAVREMRRRNGAYFWELFHDSADPARFVECFMDESWLEHLRQHERVERRRPRDPATREAVPGRRRDDAVRSTGSPTANPDPGPRRRDGLGLL